MWLLGAGCHWEGSATDAYAYLKALDDSGRLLPTEEDYDELDRWRTAQGVYDFEGLIAAVREEGADMIARAEAMPGSPQVDSSPTHSTTIYESMK